MKKASEYEIEIDDLALGLTRPPMIFGVTVKVAFGNLVLCALGYIYTRSFYVVPLFGILHLVSVCLSIREPRFLELWLKKITKTPPILNHKFWGGTNSYSPD